ncbi:MAG: carboxypeptidase regulatory-like domain-containing protein, partial [Armatimonadota bacterium]
MRGHGKRLGIALIFCILLLPVLTSARSPDGAIRPQGLDRTSYTSYLQLPSAWRPPMVAGTGRRVPLDRSMLPHIFDPLIAAQARTRQGSQPDTNLTPTATLSEEIQPTWARDEALETIAFVSNGVDVDGLPGIDPGVTTADGTYNIWLMRPDGSQPRRLTLEDGSNELDPEYDTGSRVIAYASDKTGTYEIYTINVASGAVTQITTSTVVAGDKRHPTWSADRSLIAFQIEPTPGNWDIYTIASSGVGQPLPLITNATNDTDPTFHPSNPDVLAFTSDRTGAENIYRYERATALETQLTDGGGTATVNDKDPAWRSTGDQLAFASDRAQEPGDATADYNVWTLSWDGEVLGPPPTLKSNKGVTDTEDDENPAWSPVDIGTPPPGGGGDFVQIAFQSRRPGGQPVDDADIWSVLETDIIAPILLGMETGEAMVVEPRFAMPGDTVTLSVAVDDIDSGVAAVACQIKDPDGMVEDAEGIDHHHYIHSFGSFNGGLSGTSWIEVDFETVGLLALYDDGVPPDVTAGDNVWTGEWVTLSVPSDFLVDVITVDEAGNSQEYDNLYGFSTQLFTPQAHVLYVDDHASGQQFASTAYTIHRNVQWPGGTYHLLNWGGHAAPLLPIPPLTTPPFPEYGNVWAHNFSQSVPGYAASPYAEDVDVWRIQCRGLPPRHVIDFYGPTSEVQLSLGDYTQTRTVNVADRAIWWGAPQSGDVYATLGAITDGETQAELMRFLDRGGRLCITGGDIAWALTIDGQQGSAFLNNYLQATYVRDSLGTPDTGSMTINGTGGDPVVFGPFGHWGPSPGPPATLHTPVHPTQGYRDAYWWSQYPDVVQAGGAGVASYTYGTAGAAAVRHDAAAGYRTVYFALGFENIHREYTTNQGCLNYRGKIVHNVLCWMRTGTYTGRVLAKNGLKPISPPPVVEVLRGGTARHAVRCNQDGSWVVNGVAPATYSLRASAVGYYDHLESNLSVHGMGNLRPVRRDFVLSKAEPGGLSGTVTSAATGQPLPNVTMTAFEPIGMTTYPDPGDPPILTAADGTYAISGLPRADYEVTADGTAINYSTETQTATVLPAQNTPDVDFALTAADGTLDVTVTDSEAVPSPIPNADVQVKDAITGAPVASDITDGSGEVSFSLQPGDYLVNAGAAGYETSADQAATITPLTTTAITIALVEVPPGSISGLISRQTDGSLVDG